MKVERKSYKLHNKIQHYDWGTKNEEAFIPNFLGIKPVLDETYAELWIGAHPKSPSEIVIDDTNYNLNEVIELFPNEILGEKVAAKFNNKLPFLLKVLSAARALSIQTHPNKQQAEFLHQKDPINYPDDNHKPEIAIALDSLIAVAGFRPTKEIKEIFTKNYELRDFVGDKNYECIVNGDEAELEANIKTVYNFIMRKAEDTVQVEKLITRLLEKFSKLDKPSKEEIQFMEQYKLYGFDTGLLSFFLFNLIELKPRQAIFTDAGIPHAYIKGNIVECMANSDNVVRAGLTNKFQDVEVLLDIIDYSFEKYNIINDSQDSDEVIFKTTAKEFEVSLLSKSGNEEREYLSNNKPAIFIVLSGSIAISSHGAKEQYVKGEVFLVPAVVSEYKIIFNESSEVISVQVP